MVYKEEICAIILSTLLERSENMTNLPPKKGSPTGEFWAWFEAHITPQIEKALFREAFFIVWNYHDAQDAYSNALEHAVRHLWQLRSEDRFYQWMCTIVRREASHLRPKKQFLLFSDTQHDMRNLESDANLENDVLGKELAQQLRKELDALKSPEKEILILKGQSNRSLKEIAEELHLNYHTTRSKYQRTIKYLRKKLEAGDDGHEKK